MQIYSSFQDAIHSCADKFPSSCLGQNLVYIRVNLSHAMLPGQALKFNNRFFG